MHSIKSIFNIERREEFSHAFDEYLHDIRNSEMCLATDEMETVFRYLDHCVRHWPYRFGATSLKGFLAAIGVDLEHPQSDDDRLLIMELLINLLHWAPKQDTRDVELSTNGLVMFTASGDVARETNRLLTNADYILEQCCNMRVRETKGDDDFPQYRVCKRDTSVDAAIVAAPELSDVLLGYLDVRNANSETNKKKALLAIYAYIEPKRKEYRGITGVAQISEEFFASMNSFGIRHSTDRQIELKSEENNDIFDSLFRIAIYVLQSKDAISIKNELRRRREGALT